MSLSLLAGEGRTPRVPAASIANVSKRFGETQALDGVSLTFEAGTIHALVGSNGSGKSTLIKILAGVYGADAGTVELGGTEHDLRGFSPETARDCGLHFVHQERSTFPQMSVADNLAIGGRFETGVGFRIKKAESLERARELLARFHIQADPRTELRHLRPAEQTMVAIARALQGQEDGASGVLILDEPTASLPLPEVSLLFEALRRYAEAGQAIVLVSHRLEEVLDLASVISVLRDGRLVASVDRADVDEPRLAELIVGRHVVETFREPSASSPREAILVVRGIRGGVVHGVDVTVDRGEIIGITGLAGSGCSTLLRMIFGAQEIESGEVSIGGKAVSFRNVRDAMDAGVAFVPPNRVDEALFPEYSVRENITSASTSRYWERGMLRRQIEARDVEVDISRLDIRTASLETPISRLSGGNQQKAILGRWLRRQPSLLLLDEPTQGVDVGARAELWEIVGSAVDEGAGVLVASSDLDELSRVCQRIVILRNGLVTTELEGANANVHEIFAQINGRVPQ